ncbi:hypothetical protein Mevan_0403 [Methanococcus vannielii SB]|uniref:Uncharacterized protein n=1 Tax=Methanococcus vannielii (strain ATCC 35089 / DSM 1224 / JCM 13029 / OCM 148 / SB) TaxID=406327 RepID=A6UP89_METVS|nr:hypothetical protein [Methanococcus vannielii]ABR54311.1 hypothetical protein Mevan_0403 [Methanococcus vannielii SB]
MPYIIKNKKFSNYWFSSSNGANVSEFINLLSYKNIDKLEEEGGLCIIYTHFAQGFIKNGEINQEFKDRIKYLSKKDGWFAPASEILDYLF